MKAGDLIHMPGETVIHGGVPSIGIVIDTEPRHLHDKRVGILWGGTQPGRMGTQRLVGGAR